MLTVCDFNPSTVEAESVDLYFKVSLVCGVSYRPVKATGGDVVSNKTKQQA